MKKESGITLAMLTIYVVGLMFIIIMVTAITNFLNNNILNMEEASKYAAEFSKFNIFFVEEVKKYGNSIIEIDESHVKFNTGNIYYIQNNKIYRNSVPIVNDVKTCIFRKKMNETKEIVSVLLEIGEENTFLKRIDYVLSNVENHDESIIAEGTEETYQYTVTVNLGQGLSIDNPTTNVVYGDSYSATITPDDTHTLSELTVTMGGTNIVSNDTTGIINISKITGNIVINAISTVLSP